MNLGLMNFIEFCLQRFNYKIYLDFSKSFDQHGRQMWKIRRWDSG